MAHICDEHKEPLGGGDRGKGVCKDDKSNNGDNISDTLVSVPN